MSKKENNSKACAPVRREKDLLQHMIDCAKNIHLVYLDVDFNFVRVNRAYADTCGYKPSEMIGKNHFALYPHKENEEIFKRVRDTGVPAQYHDKPFTFSDQPARGTTYWDWTLEPVKDNSGKVIGLIFSLVETTERKRAEEDLARIASFPTNNPNPIFEADFEGNVTYSNPAAKSGFGIETVGSSRPLLADWKNVVKTVTKSSASFTREVKAGDRWYHQQLYLVPYTKCIRVYSSDITERKKSENEVLKQKVQAERYLNIVGSMILALNVQGQITLLNKKGYEILGYNEGELEGKDWVDTCLPEDIRNELQKVHRDWVTGKIETPEHYENAVLRKNGEIRIISWYNSEIRDENQKIIGTLSSGEDITERKKAEEALKASEQKLEEYSKNLEKLVEERTKQLKDSERLAAIGATAGMVGHDIRNPLQSITSDLYLAKTELASTADTDEKKNTLESLAEIENNIDYINKIVQDLQDYARPLSPKIEEANLKQIIEKLLTKNKVPNNVKTSIKLEDGTTKVCADPYYINRIMYNLVINAVQAMPQGGNLTIQAHKEGTDTVISVKDTGVGIPKEIQGKMFTAMFTTKSKGQGFGLPVVKRMTESLGGTVTFESQVGKGTIFVIRFPPPPRAKR